MGALEIASIYGIVAFASIWGVLARLGLNWIGSFSTSVFPSIWAQLVGCFIMGLTNHKKSMSKFDDDKAQFRAILDVFHHPTHIAITTGLCGSITTFSTWMVDIFLAWAGLSPIEDSNSRFRAFMNGFTILVITTAVSSRALHSGFIFAKHSLPKAWWEFQYVNLSPYLEWAYIVLGIGGAVGAGLIAGLESSAWRSRASFAAAFGIPGALLRFQLARSFNRAEKPYGTLIANLLGVLLYAVFWDLMYLDVSPISCDVLSGLQNGFCGALTTVSTFVFEVRSLPGPKSYAYFLISLGLSQALCVLIIGSFVWSGAREAKCTV